MNQGEIPTYLKVDILWFFPFTLIFNSILKIYNEHGPIETKTSTKGTLEVWKKGKFPGTKFVSWLMAMYIYIYILLHMQKIKKD